MEDYLSRVSAWDGEEEGDWRTWGYPQYGGLLSGQFCNLLVEHASIKQISSARLLVPLTNSTALHPVAGRLPEGAPLPAIQDITGQLHDKLHTNYSDMEDSSDSTVDLTCIPHIQNIANYQDVTKPYNKKEHGSFNNARHISLKLSLAALAVTAAFAVQSWVLHQPKTPTATYPKPLCKVHSPLQIIRNPQLRLGLLSGGSLLCC